MPARWAGLQRKEGGQAQAASSDSQAQRLTAAGWNRSQRGLQVCPSGRHHQVRAHAFLAFLVFRQSPSSPCCVELLHLFRTAAFVGMRLQCGDLVCRLHFFLACVRVGRSRICHQLISALASRSFRPAISAARRQRYHGRLQSKCRYSLDACGLCGNSLASSSKRQKTHARPATLETTLASACSGLSGGC